MIVTNGRGLANPVHDAQRTYRALLAALAYPGRRYDVDCSLAGPPALGSALAACALTLFDDETAVWLDARARDVAGAWLVSQTACRIARAPREADFAVVCEPSRAPALDAWRQGILEEPETSTTLLVQIDALRGGAPVLLRGPGIATEFALAAAGLPDRFWDEWSTNVRSYPLGVDCFFFDAHGVAGLPRAVEARRG